MEAGFTQDVIINKLIMLYVFDKMENALTEKTLLDVCTYKNNWISHYDCLNTLDLLIESNFIYKSIPRSTSKHILYTLTADGRDCLHCFYQRVPSSLRRQIDSAIKSDRIVYRRTQDYIANYEKCPDGTYNVTLRIDEPPKTALNIVINVPTRSDANEITRAWSNKAPRAYAKLHELLLDN